MVCVFSLFLVEISNYHSNMIAICFKDRKCVNEMKWKKKSENVCCWDYCFVLFNIDFDWIAPWIAYKKLRVDFLNRSTKTKQVVNVPQINHFPNKIICILNFFIHIILTGGINDTHGFHSKSCISFTVYGYFSFDVFKLLHVIKSN